jgi:hypothetical protein
MSKILLTIIVVPVALGGCATTEKSAREPAAAKREVTSIDGYDLSQDVKSALAFKGNSTVVVGRVSAVSDPIIPLLSKEAQAEAGDAGEPLPRLVSVIVDVTITDVVRGDWKAGQVVRVRMIGGTAENVETRSETSGWSNASTVGRSVALFGGAQVTYEGGLTLMTPNQFYAESDGVFSSPLEPTVPGFTLDELRSLASEPASSPD